jgi:uncharacterized SAM-binding protein YcdF (DUF218 family)
MFMDHLYFIASKVIGFFLEPLHLMAALVGLLGVTVWMGAHRVARWLALVCVGAIGLVGLTPLWNAALMDLETQYPVPAETQSAAGIVVLGGALSSGFIAEKHGQVALNSAAERMTKAVELMDRHPDLPLIFSGFSGRFIRSQTSESDLALQFFEASGINTDRIILENQSRNTYENAKYSQELIDFAGQGPWILVTSAFHMPRAAEIFTDRRIEIIAYPTDFRSQATPPWRWDLAEGAEHLGIVMHEWIGIWVYRLSQKPGNA